MPYFDVKVKEIRVVEHTITGLRAESEDDAAGKAHDIVRFDGRMTREQTEDGTSYEEITLDNCYNEDPYVEQTGEDEEEGYEWDTAEGADRVEREQNICGMCKVNPTYGDWFHCDECAKALGI